MNRQQSVGGMADRFLRLRRGDGIMVIRKY